MPWSRQMLKVYICATSPPSCTFQWRAALWRCLRLDNIRVTVIDWRLRGNIIRTPLCWIVWHSAHTVTPLLHTYMSSSYRSNRLGLSHWDSYAMRRGSCLELYYRNMVEWFWWDSSLISTTNWFHSVLWHCWFGHLACRNRPWNDYNVLSGTLSFYTTTTTTMLDLRVWDIPLCLKLTFVVPLGLVRYLSC